MDDFGPNEFGEFDDWYNDGENCGEELQNQAATLDKAEKEERTFRDEDLIKEDAVCWGGELFVRFVNHDGKKFVKRASAHMVKQTSDDSFVALTARTNLHYKPPDGSEPLHASEGYFFLQRTDERDFAAVFKFKNTGIRHFKQ